MGEDHIMLTEAAAREPQQISERVVYRSEALAIAPEQLAVLGKPCVALAHAAGALSDLHALLTRHGLNKCQIRVAAMSPRIAQSANSGWESLTAAPTPSDAALLALAADLCRQ
jgi:uroporphyrinogen-III synthase